MGRRVDRRNKLKKPGQRRGKHYSATPVGRVTLKLCEKLLADHLAAVLTEEPSRRTEAIDEAPGQLGPLLRQIPPQELAQTVLLPLMHSLAISWQDTGRDWRRETVERVGRNVRDLLAHKKALSAGQLILDMKPSKKRKVGRPRQADIRDLITNEWDAGDLCQVGDWFVVQAMKMPYLTSSRSRWPYMPDIAPGWVGKLAAIRRQFVEADKDQLPTQEPPPDWTGMKNGRVSFISGNHPECRQALTTAIEENDTTFMEHVAGVNALQRVPLKINKFALDLVEEFAVKLLDRKHVDPIKGDDKKTERKRKGIKRRNWAIVHEDLEFAKVIMDRGTFYNLHHCDWRGRVIPVPFLHHQRADHVRALFTFAEGAKLSSRVYHGKSDVTDRPSYHDGQFGFSDLEMLMIHVANCHGEADKEPWGDRIKWVDKRLKNGDIRRIATNPSQHSDLWVGADSPFSYAAACRELISALEHRDHVSHLPIFFDATASGLQHLALLSRDPVAAKLVNLTDDSHRYDVYGIVADAAIEILQTRDFKTKEERKRANWWRNFFPDWTPQNRRKVVKQAVMIYPYGSTETGMASNIGDGFREVCNKLGASDEHLLGSLKFLAEIIVEAIGKVLPGAERSRSYLGNLAFNRVVSGLGLDLFTCVFDGEHFVKWRSPSGFPVISAYYKPNVHVLRLSDGGEMRVTIGDTPTVNTDKAIDSIAPNFVHSLDAAHLMRCVLSANRAGITNLLTIHDCWGCLAPDAADMHRIFRNELYMMYNYTNWMQYLALNNDYREPMLLGGYDMEQLPRCNYGAS